MSKEQTLDQKAEDIEGRLREIARLANVSTNDIYNLIFRQYKTDNALRTEANKNAELVIQEKRIQLDGRKFLIDEYYTIRRLKKIQREQRRSAWRNKHVFSIFKKKKPSQPIIVNKNNS